MNQQQIRKIKEYAEKLLSLCIGEPIPPHKTSGNGHWESCEQDAYQVGKILNKGRRAYYKKVCDVLGDDADDWVFIARTFEDLKPQWFSRLEDMRQKILQHTHPDKQQVNWLEAQGGNFGPNKDLLSLIKRLANELLQEVETSGKIEPQEKAGQEKGKKITKDEANVRARDLIKENPSITIAKLSEKLSCSTGLVSELPVWRVLMDYREKTFGTKRPKMVPLTKNLEYILGTQDEKLNQLIAEREGEEREDERKARLYLSHKKKHDRGRG
jgi:hypothetical protein